MSWETNAACQAETRLLFFGPDGESPSECETREQQAKAICATCLVRVPCLQAAMSAHVRYGIWGGLTENERKRERRQRRRYRAA